MWLERVGICECRWSSERCVSLGEKVGIHDYKCKSVGGKMDVSAGVRLGMYV